MGWMKEILERHGAYKKGLFILSSNALSDTYIQFSRISSQPALLRKVALVLAYKMRKEISETPNLVVSPAFGGLLLAHELAEEFKATNVFFEKYNGEFTLRRDFPDIVRNIEKEYGQIKAVFVEDVISTGGTVYKCITKFLEMFPKADVICVATPILRGDAEWLEDFKIVYVENMPERHFKSVDELPEELKHLTPEKPGSSYF